MRYIGYILFALMLGNVVQAQHTPLYSQYVFNGMVINPAYTGIRDVATFSLSHRDQWAGFDGAPKTSYFSAESPINNSGVDVGLLYQYETIGVTKQQQILGSYAYRMDNGTFFTTLGISAGTSIITNNWSQVHTIENADVNFQGLKLVNVIPQFGFGLLINSDKFSVGFSIPQLMHLSGVGTVGMRMSEQNLIVRGGYNWDISEHLTYNPVLLFRKIVVGPQQLEINNLFVYNNVFGFGVGYRLKEAVNFLFKIKAREHIYFGYSYDYSISKLQKYNSGSHELYLRYELHFKKDVVNPRFF